MIRGPRNYHLTFSGDGNKPEDVREVLASGKNVALVFWPILPATWLGREVIDGDTHDARFRDNTPRIVGLRAKGFARVDIDGFVARPCPRCLDGDETGQGLKLIGVKEDTHRTTVHECATCGYRHRSRWMLPARVATVGRGPEGCVMKVQGPVYRLVGSLELFPVLLKIAAIGVAFLAGRFVGW